MSPKYAMNGILSSKVDVISFGVLVLEIISGKKNNSCCHAESPLNLTGYVRLLEIAFEFQTFWIVCSLT